MRSLLLIPFGFLLLSAFVLGFKPSDLYRHDGKVLLPNPDLTPGVVRTSDEHEICAKGFRTAPYRKTTESTKHRVYVEYGVQRGVGILREGYEIDHLLPLELGGADDVENLWPEPAEPRPAFHEKDELENKLKELVCVEHRLTLKDAQGCIISNWFRCYQRWVPRQVPLGRNK